MAQPVFGIDTGTRAFVATSLKDMAASWTEREEITELFSMQSNSGDVYWVLGNGDGAFLCISPSCAK